MPVYQFVCHDRVRDYSVVNARSREIGAILQAEGYTVRYVYPEDADTVSTLGGRNVQA